MCSAAILARRSRDGLAAKKAKRKLQFRPRAPQSSKHFIAASWRPSASPFGAFMSGNVEDPRKLIREKTELRNAELAAAERHFDRLREARTESMETTSIHLDVLRDLKRIHSHVCSVADAVLEAAGETAAAAVSERPGDACGVRSGTAWGLTNRKNRPSRAINFLSSSCHKTVILLSRNP
jgi:hypothetical protein